MEIRSRKDILIDIRNQVLDQLLRLEVDIKFFTRQLLLIKDDKERTDALNKKSGSEQGAKFKKSVLECIDDLIAQEEKTN